MIKKNSILLLSLFIMCGFIAVNADESNQCYCSYLCEFRDVKDDDKPFICPETEVCFCKVRDQEKFFEHGCNEKDNCYADITCCSNDGCAVKS